MEVKAFSPEKKELEKERSLLAEESDAEPRKLRARQVKETTTEVKCEKKEIAEPKEAARNFKPHSSNSIKRVTTAAGINTFSRCSDF